MAVSLTKGGNINLSDQDGGLRSISIGLGWDARTTDGVGFDLDASAFMLGSSEKVTTDDDFVFYGSYHRTEDGITVFDDPGRNVSDEQRGMPCHPSLCVIHTGDNLTGSGEGDDEVIRVNLDKVPSQYQKIVITVTIHDAGSRNQNFGQVRNAFIRIINEDTMQEITRYDLSEDYSIETAMIFGEVYRYNSAWKFRAVGQGYSGGLAKMCAEYGIEIA